MAWERDNENDEYYVPIQNRSGWIIVKPNRFWQETEISLGLLNFQYNAFLKTSRPGSIETIKSDLPNVSILKAIMNQMDQINWNFDDRFIKLEDPIYLSDKTFQKYHLHLGEAMKSDDWEDFMKTMGNEIWP